jgi:hypothetical protein
MFSHFCAKLEVSDWLWQNKHQTRIINFSKARRQDTLQNFLLGLLKLKRPSVQHGWYRAMYNGRPWSPIQVLTTGLIVASTTTSQSINSRCQCGRHFCKRLIPIQLCRLLSFAYGLSTAFCWILDRIRDDWITERTGGGRALRNQPIKVRKYSWGWLRVPAIEVQRRRTLAVLFHHQVICLTRRKPLHPATPCSGAWCEKKSASIHAAAESTSQPPRVSNLHYSPVGSSNGDDADVENALCGLEIPGDGLL